MNDAEIFLKKRYSQEFLDEIFNENVQKAVILETYKGEIVIELFHKDVPLVKEVITKVLLGEFEGMTFHNCNPFFVQLRKGSGEDETAPKSIVPFLRNTKGTVGLVNSKKNPSDSSMQHLYICLKNIPEFDDKYTIIGKVISGLDVLEKMWDGNTVKGVYIAKNFTEKQKAGNKLNFLFWIGLFLAIVYFLRYFSNKISFLTAIELKWLGKTLIEIIPAPWGTGLIVVSVVLMLFAVVVAPLIKRNLEKIVAKSIEYQSKQRKEEGKAKTEEVSLKKTSEERTIKESGIKRQKEESRKRTVEEERRILEQKMREKLEEDKRKLEEELRKEAEERRIVQEKRSIEREKKRQEEAKKFEDLIQKAEQERNELGEQKKRFGELEKYKELRKKTEQERKKAEEIRKFEELRKKTEEETKKLMFINRKKEEERRKREEALLKTRLQEEEKKKKRFEEEIKRATALEEKRKKLEEERKKLEEKKKTAEEERRRRSIEEKRIKLEDEMRKRAEEEEERRKRLEEKNMSELDIETREKLELARKAAEEERRTNPEKGIEEKPKKIDRFAKPEEQEGRQEILERMDTGKDIKQEIKAKKKEEIKEQVLPQIAKRTQTHLDVLYDLLEKYDSLKLSYIMKTFNIDKEEALEWCNILVEHGLAEVNYPAFGEPTLIKKEISSVKE